MNRKWMVGVLAIALGVLSNGQLDAQDKGDAGHENSRSDDHDAPHHAKIKSFSVEQVDETLTYPSYLVDIPDEHTTLLPQWSWANPWPEHGPVNYLLFASSAVTGASGGAVVLETPDLKNFTAATAEGYAEQVMTSPVAFRSCDPAYDQEFDENYGAPGSVVQDPTLPPGNLIMIYEAENHCPNGVHNASFYATVGFARSSDNGKSWPAPPTNQEFGNADRHPIFKDFYPEIIPGTPVSTESMGDALPSALVDIDRKGDAYLYVVYGYARGSNLPLPSDGLIRIGRGNLGRVYHDFDGDDHDSWDNDSTTPGPSSQVQFYKWYNGSFSQPGIAGLDSGIIPTTGCTGRQSMAGLTYNAELGLYILTFVCNPSSTSPAGVVPSKNYAAWYYSTATSLEREDWTTPQPIQNSEREIVAPCNTTDPKEPSGSAFDGFYPSFMTPGSPAGHTGLTGLAFFLNGCYTGLPRHFASRKFAITTEP
jgi:hypothetical protein